MSNHAPGTLLAVREGRMGKTVILILAADGNENERLTISRGTYESHGAPAVGTYLDDEILASLRHASALRETLGAALRILEYGDTTRAKLREKLQMRGFKDDCINATIAEVIRRGYINEERTAARQVVLCAKKGWGRRKIYAYLISHGIPGDIAATALDNATHSGEVDFFALRRAFIEERRNRGMTEDAILRALYRAGF